MQEKRLKEKALSRRSFMRFGVCGCSLCTISACTPAVRKGIIDNVGLVDKRTADNIGVLTWDYVLATERISKDTDAKKKVSDVLVRLDDALGNHGVEWEFAVFDSPQVNAFAISGGKIGIYRGLFTVANTPGRLAAVIGHEMGHIIGNHQQSKLKVDAARDIALKISELTAKDSARQKLPYIIGSRGALAALQVGFELPFSRQLETEADVFSVKAMRLAGYDPLEAIDLWNAMTEESGDRSIEWLNSHPSRQTRIETIRDEISAS